MPEPVNARRQTPAAEAGGQDHNAFLRLLGARQVPAPQGRVCIVLPQLREDLLNQLPAAHGGVLMTLLDAAMSRAAAALPDAPAQTAVTVEMSSRFHRPGQGALVAEGWVVHASRSLCSCAARITRENGELVASAQGTFKYWLKPTRPLPDAAAFRAGRGPA